MHQFHSSICEGNHYWKTTAHKILRAGYYWPALFFDMFSFVKSCDQFQRVTTKKSIGNSPFKLVYGTEVVFPIQLTVPVAKFLQEELDEGDDMARRMSDLVEIQQIKEQLIEKLVIHQKKIKEVFDKKAKMDSFRAGDRVLKWDAYKEKKGNHGEFDALWTRPFIIA
eukprot:PITA_14656